MSNAGRTPGIIKAVLLIIVAALLTLALISGLHGNRLGRAITLTNGKGALLVANSEGKISVSPSEVKIIRSDLASEDFTIESAEIGEISVEIRGGEEKDRPKVKRSGETLQIQAKEANGIVGLKLVKPVAPKMEVVVKVPKSGGKLKRIKADAASGKITVKSVCAGAIDVESASGNIVCVDCSADELSVENVSGAIALENCSGARIKVETVSGATEISDCDGRLSAESVSGSITATWSEPLAHDCSFESVSGSVRLLLDAKSSFTALCKSVSGSIKSTFGAAGNNLKKTISNGSGTDAYIEIETVSGSIMINEK